ncbi:hypothetical protein HMPREF0591_2102 [Mycobacterium parascrofulaceum ATCC BAA-614]|uniref:Uncharacterized protein n=2 Tax=Mycobacterium parascrofulaceum TaxID=240125 RepID=D5P7F8_9MYCO|nr:hypothetical protein HMPREF0591_2102 [Mycobacterium parascrofulaceum ATCC BAA-614]OCB28186.1 hypothetical protein A9X02_03220 [Mycobacterium malmoense]
MNSPSEPTSADWDFPTLAHVWDYRSKAIIAGADRLEALTPPDRARSLEELGDRVRTLVRTLDDSWLVATAVFMVEDLYKSFFREFRWSSGVADYIAGSAGVFMREFTEREFVLNYVIDNTESEADLAEMLTYVPEVFRAAGLRVVGPQLMALEIMERIEGRPQDVAALPSTIDEGQHLAEQFVTQCHEDRRSYVYLNLQLAEDNSRLSLDVALSNTDAPGTLVVFRNQPPAAGTTVEVSAPPGVTMPTV